MIAMLLPLIPFVIAYMCFFYFILFLEWDFMYSLGISVGIGSGGFTVYYGYRDRVRKKISNMEGINAILRWGKSLATWENGLILRKIPIREDPYKDPFVRVKNTQSPPNELPGSVITPIDAEFEVVYDRALEPKGPLPVHMKDGKPQFTIAPTRQIVRWETDAEGVAKRVTRIEKIDIKPLRMGMNEILLADPSLVSRILPGKYATEVSTPNVHWAPNGVPYKKIMFIHPYPAGAEFYNVPDQFVVYEAQLLGGATILIDATFLYWTERTEPIPVFYVTSSPQLTELIQQCIGIKPTLANNEDNTERGLALRFEISEALKLGDSNQALGLAMLLESRSGTIDSLIEGKREAEDIGIGLASQWNLNRDIIREPRVGLMQKLATRRNIAILSLILLVGIAVWWVFF